MSLHMIFLTSDTHFAHKNICRATSQWDSGSNVRDFESLEKMNNFIVDSINSIVGRNDILYHLGDFAFSGVENYRVFRERLNCNHIHLILGNHDGRHGREFDPVMKNGQRVSQLFESYSVYKELHVKKQTFILFHYPIYSWNHMSSGSIHCFGHTHSSMENRFFNGGKSIDVGVDSNNYYPYSLDEVVSLVSALPIRREGHH